MSHQKINIAIVRSKCYLNGTYLFDLVSMLTKKLENSDYTYKNIKISFEAVGWDVDVPNDWDRFTHILLGGGGIDYIEHPQKFLSWLDGLSPSNSKKVLNSPSIIRWNMNKNYLSEMQNSGISIIPTVFLNKDSLINGVEIMKKLKSLTDKKIATLILKNLIDAGGNSIKKIQLESPDLMSEEVLKIIKEMLDETDGNGLMVQRFIPTIQTEGEWSLIYFDRKLSHCALKKPKENEIRVHLGRGAIFEIVNTEKVPRTVLDFGKKVIDFIPETENLLYARVDMVRDGEDTFLMELELFEPDLYLRDGKSTENFLNAICSPKYNS